MNESMFQYLKSLDSNKVIELVGDLQELKDVLEKYVSQFECDDECIEIVRKNLTRPVSKTVYRGQNINKIIYSNVPWFSTTSNKKVAEQEFSSDGCCVFTIHLVDVPLLDIYSIITKGSYGHEDEIIVLGGGTFYNSDELKIKGFNEIFPGQYETRYSLTPAEEISIDRLISQIPVEEYEFREYHVSY